MNKGFYCFNILDMLDSIGEDNVKNILSVFSCPKNKEIENFLKKNAIIFAQKKMSVTYLIFDNEKNLLGYYTLTHKMLQINKSVLSKSKNKIIERYSVTDNDTQSHNISAFLIAQFGKNFAVNNGNNITGNLIMNDAVEKLQEAQHIIGGGVIFLECENKKELLNFYDSNNFKLFGSRESKNDDTIYEQLLRIF